MKLILVTATQSLERGQLVRIGWQWGVVLSEAVSGASVFVLLQE